MAGMTAPLEQHTRAGTTGRGRLLVVGLVAATGVAGVVGVGALLALDVPLGCRSDRDQRLAAELATMAEVGLHPDGVHQQYEHASSGCGEDGVAYAGQGYVGRSLADVQEFYAAELGERGWVGTAQARPGTLCWTRDLGSTTGYMVLEEDAFTIVEAGADPGRTPPSYGVWVQAAHDAPAGC